MPGLRDTVDLDTGQRRKDPTEVSHPLNDADQTVSDLDEYVTVRLDDDKIVVEVSPAGFRQPSNVIADLITELARMLPRPEADGREAIGNSIVAINRAPAGSRIRRLRGVRGRDARPTGHRGPHRHPEPRS